MITMDTVNYILFKNPVVSYSLGAVKYAANVTGSAIGYAGKQPSVDYSTLTKKELLSIFLINRNYMRLAGILGVSAVIIGAYGAHTLLAKDGHEHEKKVFETASRYHFYHTLALFAVPFSKFPKVTAFTMVGGILLFCGSCYYETLMEDDTYRKVTPYGGSLLILSWLTMIL